MENLDDQNLDTYQILLDDSKDLNTFRAKLLETYRKMSNEIDIQTEKAIKQKHLTVKADSHRRANSVIRTQKPHLVRENQIIDQMFEHDIANDNILKTSKK